MTKIKSAQEFLPAAVSVPIQFDGQLVFDSDTKIKVSVTITEDGIRMTTKKDDVFFRRDQWLLSSLADNTVALVVQGYGYDQWSQKRKHEKNHPDQPFPYEPVSAVYTINFRPKKLDGFTTEDLGRQLERTYRLAYLDGFESPDSLKFASCDDCSTTMDVTPYAESPNLFCYSCSKLMGKQVAGQGANNGICDRCGFYSRLANYDADTKTCHHCRVRMTMWAFFMSMLSVAGILILNFATIYFLDRFFPVLLIIGAVMLLYNIWLVIKIIALSAARKSFGTTEIEKATELLRKGKAEKAYDVINQMGSSSVDNPGILLNLAKGMMKAKNYDQAEDIVETLIADFPNFHFGHYTKVEILGEKEAPGDTIAQAYLEANQVLGRNMLRNSQKVELAS